MFSREPSWHVISFFEPIRKMVEKSISLPPYLAKANCFLAWSTNWFISRLLFLSLLSFFFFNSKCIVENNGRIEQQRKVGLSQQLSKRMKWKDSKKRRNNWLMRDRQAQSLRDQAALCMIVHLTFHSFWSHTKRWLRDLNYLKISDLRILRLLTCEWFGRDRRAFTNSSNRCTSSL